MQQLGIAAGGRQHGLPARLPTPLSGSPTRQVGGLTDGLLFAKYCRPLAAKLEAAQWSLVQTLLSSSHAGYGTASLDQDAAELRQLACHLAAEYGSQVGWQEGGHTAAALAARAGHPAAAFGTCCRAKGCSR